MKIALLTVMVFSGLCCDYYNTGLNPLNEFQYQVGVELVKDIRTYEDCSESSRYYMVVNVVNGSPAYKAGLRVWDTIVNINGLELSNSKKFKNLVLTRNDYDIEILRECEPMNIKIPSALITKLTGSFRDIYRNHPVNNVYKLSNGEIKKLASDSFSVCSLKKTAIDLNHPETYVEDSVLKKWCVVFGNKCTTYYNFRGPVSGMDFYQSEYDKKFKSGKFNYRGVNYYCLYFIDKNETFYISFESFERYPNFINTLNLLEKNPAVQKTIIVKKFELFVDYLNSKSKETPEK